MSSWENLTKEEFQKIVDECFSYSDIAYDLGFNYANGRVCKIIKLLCEKHNVSCSHLDPHRKKRLNAKYKEIIKKCPVCNTEFTVKDGHPREKTTCSMACSNTFFASRRHSAEINLKTSQSLKAFNSEKRKSLGINAVEQQDKVFFVKNCETCGQEFLAKKKKIRFCSNICARNNTEIKSKISAKIKERIKNGTFSGWKSRLKVKRSFPEQYTQSLLDELGIKTEPEYKVGRWFIDFADVERKLAFEVDGKQHELPERKLSDEEKDQFLIENGWKVKRYKWKRIISKNDREELKSILVEFFQST